MCARSSAVFDGVVEYGIKILEIQSWYKIEDMKLQKEEEFNQSSVTFSSAKRPFLPCVSKLCNIKEVVEKC